MLRIQPQLCRAFVTVIDFLIEYPEAATLSRGRNAASPGSLEYIERQAEAFATSRRVREPSSPATIPDTMVRVILREHFKVGDTERAEREHLLSMGAENAIGDLLERYLASVIEPVGWVWCSGSLVRAVDFIRSPEVSGGTSWELLQVKNRDNSENSSSSSVRVGTAIMKWHRTFSRRPQTNWPAFPDPVAAQLLSEENFVVFVQDYLAQLPHGK